MRLLEGSCHCGAVRFSLASHAPRPYMRCYCSICRKTAGGGGYAINLMADAASLKLQGEEHMTVYRVRLGGEDDLSPARRHFCKHCGTALYVFDPRWPDLVHPFASAVDTPLPPAPGPVHIMLDSKPDWVEAPVAGEADCYDEYPEESIEGWHKSRGLWEA